MRRSKVVYDVPPDVRRELDQRIVAAGYGRYATHRDWLVARGHHVSESSLQRYGVHLKQLEFVRVATREATALVDSTPDDGHLADASVRLAQAAIYDLLQSAGQRDVKSTAAAARAVADLARASRSLRDERRRAIADAAEAATVAARTNGVSEPVEQAIRAAIEAVHKPA